MVYCANKKDEVYKTLIDVVGEEHASAIWDSVSGELSHKVAIELTNLSILTKDAQRREMSPEQTEFMLRNNKMTIHNIELNESNMDGKVSKALNLLQARINLLENMHVDTTDTVGISKKDLRIANLKQDYKDLKADETMTRIIEIGNKMVDWINIDLINSDKMEASALTQANYTMGIVSEMINEILQEKSMGENGEFVFASNNPILIENAQVLRSKMNLAKDELSKMNARILYNVSKNRGSRIIGVEDLTALAESSTFKSNFQFAGDIDSKLVQLVAGILQDTESNAITEYSEKVGHRLDKIVEELKKKGIDVDKPEVRNLLMQEDGKGNKTTDYVAKHSFEFTEEISKIRKALKNGKSYVEIDEKGNKSNKNPVVMLEKIAVIPDVVALFGAFSSEASIKQETDRLIQELGEEDATDLLNEARVKYDEWVRQKDLMSDRYNEYKVIKKEGYKTTEEVTKRFNEYLQENSPEGFLNYMDNKERSTRNRGVNGLKYIAIAPNKKNGLKYYDSKFIKLKENKPMFEFYTTIMDILGESLKHLPSNVTDKLNDNYMPEIDKEVSDTMVAGQWSKSAVTLYNKLVKLNSSNAKGEERTIDDGTGNKIPMIPIRYTDNRVGKFRKLITNLENDLLAQENIVETYTVKHPKFQEVFDRRVEEAEIEIEKLTKDLIEARKSYTRAIENKSTDIVGAVKTFAMMATMYKHKNQVKDVIQVAEQTANNLYAQQTNITRTESRDNQGKITKKNVHAENTLKSLKYMTDSMLYGKTKADKNATNKLVGTNEEARANLKKLSTKLKNAKENMLEGKISREEYDLIEENVKEEGSKLHGVNNFSFGRMLDNLTQIAFFRGMAWGVRSAISNVVIAKVANSIEAASGQFFGQKSLNKATTFMREAVKNSIGLRNDEALKIANLMHRYGIMFKNLESAYGGSQSTGEYFKKLGIAAPLELQKRGEYYNQGVTLLAMLFENKVMTKEGVEIPLYEAYDKDGILREDIDNRESWSTPESALKTNTFTKLRSKVLAVMRRVHGNYDKPMLAKKTAVGRSLMGFKTWLPESFASRFGEEFYSDIYGGVIKGRYRSYGDLFKTKGSIGALNVIKNIMINDWFGKANDPSYTGLKTIDLQNLKRNVRELQISLALAAVTLLTYLAFDDDDEEKDNIAIKVVLDMIGRAQSDITLFVNPSALNTAVIAAPPGVKWCMDVAAIFPAMHNALTKKDKRYGTVDVLRKTLRTLPMGTQGETIYKTYIEGNK